MFKNIYVLLFVCTTSVLFAQTESNNLLADLAQMRKFFMAEDYENFTNYTYPKIIEMMGGKSNTVVATKNAITKLRNDGFLITNVSFHNPSKILKNEGELQCTITQRLLMETPSETLESEYSLIGISNDNGASWTFIDTSGKSKEIMLKYFPNLHPNLVVKTKIERRISG